MKYQPKPDYVSNDCIETPLSLCQALVSVLNPYFKFGNKFLEPCAGEQRNFVKAINEVGFQSDWCEIKEGKDFYDYNDRVDWIITNPPFSKMNARTKPISFLEKAFQTSDNVCFLASLNHLLGLKARYKLMDKYKMRIAGIILCDTPPSWENSGFQVGMVHYRRYYYNGPVFTDLRGQVNYEPRNN